MNWLSYGAGVNSTALAILLCEGKLPECVPFRVLFSDTKTEKPETYAYIEKVMRPYLARYGVDLEVCAPAEGVLERWERLQVTGSRLLRSCTVEGKIKPMKRYIGDRDGAPVSLIGIHSGESHRARDARDGEIPRRYPLVDLNIDQEGCEAIIRAAGLCVPVKSGCWCCPFMRVWEVVALAKDQPQLFERIAALETAATTVHGLDSLERPRSQWGYKTTDYWRERARLVAGQGTLELGDIDKHTPCECMD